MGTLQTWRKAYGAIKDHTKLGLVHVNSDFKDVDVAIVKATNHVEYPPKERHLRKILVATSAIRPRADVAYCIHALSRRLAKTQNWTVALKTLIVIHRTLREGDPTFREEFLNFQQRGRILQLSNFKDDSSPIAWDCSAWVRTYALFLEERLECFKMLKYDIEAERLPKTSDVRDKGYSRTRELYSEELLEQLPELQQLLYRLIGCRPEGAAASNYLIQYALALVLKESFKIYCAINDGIINLVDKFFEMPKHEAMKALDIYKRAGQQALSLSDFYESCKGLELARNFQFPVLKEPPQSFLSTMEEYIREAPRIVSVPSLATDFPERLMLTYRGEDIPPLADEEIEAAPVEFSSLPKEVLISTSELSVTPPSVTNMATDDLLGLNAASHDALAIEETNALALAIVSSGDAQPNSNASHVKDFDPTGWELALVSAPSSNLSSVQDRQLAGGLDSLILNSLYDEGTYRASWAPVYGKPAPNPFEANDPFTVPSNMAIPPPVQMPIQQLPNQNNPFAAFQPAYPLPQQQHMINPQSPFGDPQFGAFHAPPATADILPQQQQMINPQSPFGDPKSGAFHPPPPAADIHHQSTNPFGNPGFSRFR